MTNFEAENGLFQQFASLAVNFAERGFRASFMSQHLRMFLADQIRGLRGDKSQAEFGKLINKPQSVVSRIEDEEYGRLSLQTLIDIAQSLDIGLVVKFVDFPTFLRETADLSDEAVVPHSYNHKQMEVFVREEYAKMVGPQNATKAITPSANISAKPTTVYPTAVPYGQRSSGFVTADGFGLQRATDPRREPNNTSDEILQNILGNYVYNLNAVTARTAPHTSVGPQGVAGWS